MDVRDLFRSPRLVQALRRGGVETVDDLLIRLAEDSLVAIDGIGRRTEQRIVEALIHRGLVVAEVH